eukprot:Skav203417  [mRNA]  locus=scaffold1743:328372:333500:- [translate_table: standard]
MAVRAGTSESVVLRIALADGLRAMERRVMGCLVDPLVHPERWYAPKDAKKGGLVAKGAAPSRDLVRTGIENVLKEVLGVSTAGDSPITSGLGIGDDSLDDFSSPLMDMGLDSLAAVEFRNRVQAKQNSRSGWLVMFDYPTVADLTDFILSQFAPDDANDDALLGGGELLATREPLSMLGLAGRYPGMSAQNDVSEQLGATFWSFLLSGRDPISEIPIERFDVDELYEEDRGTSGVHS